MLCYLICDKLLIEVVTLYCVLQNLIRFVGSLHSHLHLAADVKIGCFRILQSDQDIVKFDHRVLISSYSLQEQKICVQRNYRMNILIF
jgi:hypothetical protein